MLNCELLYPHTLLLLYFIGQAHNQARPIFRADWLQNSELGRAIHKRQFANSRFVRRERSR